MKWIVTGGAGFIGSNTVKRLVEDKHQVVVIDDLSRRGTEENLKWLLEQGEIEFVRQDIREFEGVQRVLAEHCDADAVLHLAAQVAVTTSVRDPRTDFEINAVGTFNLLEAVRKSCADAIVLYASTNKVYGKMESAGVQLKDSRYSYADLERGADESVPLDFYSPYGCSKGAADQYVRDYARIYGLRTVVFRQSCIYGPRQFGIEDQGWVAWFTIASIMGAPITIYGDGRQVRDVLYVDDLVNCYLAAAKHIDVTNGQVYNVGGGIGNQLTLLELLEFLEKRAGHPLPRKFADWRPGDQRVFVADISKAEADFGWQPQYNVEYGLSCLHEWVLREQPLLSSVLKELL